MWIRGEKDYWTSDCFLDVDQAISETFKDTIVLLFDDSPLTRAMIPLLKSACCSSMKLEVWYPCKSNVDFDDVKNIQCRFGETICLFYVDDDEDMNTAVKRFMEENKETADVFFSGTARFSETFCLADSWFSDMISGAFRDGYDFCIKDNNIPCFSTND